MENFKDLVKFNRYKSVESFNNATDVTSSTISIVKLDKNVMDIYLGRTQLTHSNFPEVSVELKSLIDSLGNKLNELKTDFNSKLTSVDDNHNKKLSKYITEFESGLIDLVNYTDELSKEIFDVKSDIQKKYDDTNKQIKNLTDSISVINGLISDQNKETNELSNKIAEIKSKQTSATNSIKNLNQDVAALKLEDIHILELISGVQTDIKKISVDINGGNDSLNVVSDRITSIENTTININSDIKSLKDRINKINSNLSNDIKTNRNDISAIKLDILDLTDIISEIKMNPVTLEPIKQDIVDLSNSIDAIKSKLSGIDENKNSINNIIAKQNNQYKDIKDIKNNIVALQIEDAHIFDILNDIKKTLSKLIDENNDINISNLIDRLSKLETTDIELNNNIVSFKEKIEKVKNDLLKSITLNKTNISNIEVKIEDIYKRLSNINIPDDNNEVDLEPIKNDIVNLTKSLNVIKTAVEEYKTKIAKLESDQISSINKIKNINNDISALKIEDDHIFDILNGLQSINKNIASDINLLKDDNKKINEDIISIKEKIEYLSGVDIDSFETLEGINRRLNKLESADKSFQKTIDELNETIKDGVNTKLKWLIL